MTYVLLEISCKVHLKIHLTGYSKFIEKNLKEGYRPLLLMT